MAPERAQGQHAGDPVGGKTMRVLELPDRLGSQRAISPVTRAGREPSPRQPPLKRADRRRTAGLEIPGAAHQRATSKRLAGLRTDDSVSHKTVSLLEALDGLRCPRAVETVDRAWRETQR